MNNIIVGMAEALWSVARGKKIGVLGKLCLLVSQLF